MVHFMVEIFEGAAFDMQRIEQFYTNQILIYR